MSVSQQPATGDGDSGDERDFPLSDALLLDLLDAMVKDRGRVAAAEALGVNYRTMMACTTPGTSPGGCEGRWRSSGTRRASATTAEWRLTMTARRTR